MKKIESILKRLYKALSIESDTEFSKKYGIKRNTISTWKKRNSTPYELLEKISQNENISFDWLLTGKGSMHLQEPSTTQNVNGNGAIISGTNQGTLITGDINISIQKHKKEVTQKEDDLLEAYRTLPSDLQDYYYHQIKADAIETKIKDKKKQIIKRLPLWYDIMQL